MSDFKAEADKIRVRARKESIRVLVWGPGAPKRGATGLKKKQYEKRRQIKHELKRVFPYSEVYFSEDREMDAAVEGVKEPLLKEAIQAKAAHLVLMLALSRGADLELDHFAPTYPWFRDKVYLLMPDKYVRTKGLVKEVYKYINPNRIEGFSDDEFKTCKVATVKAIRAADSTAISICLLSP
jgi:hypothetical protein